MITPGATSGKVETRVRLFQYFSRDNNPETYLQNCLTIVKDLRAAGAKVVFVPLPYFLESEKSRAIVRKINDTGIAVFGVLNYYNTFLRDEDIASGLLEVEFMSPERQGHSFVGRMQWHPRGRVAGTEGRRDVVLETLRKYYGAVTRDKFTWNGSEVSVGDMRFASDEEGVVLVGRTGYANLNSNVMAGYRMNFTDSMVGTPVFEYSHHAGQGRRQPKKDLLDAKDEFAGTIVVLQPNDLGGIYPAAFLAQVRPWQSYAETIDAAVAGNVLVYSRVGSLLVGLLCIVLTGLVVYRAGPLAALTLLTFLWGILIHAPAWLLQVKGVLIDFPVVFASGVASATVFAVLRLGFALTVRGRGFDRPL
jgi:hypothetical protein